MRAPKVGTLVSLVRPEIGTGPLDSAAIGRIMARLMPEDAVLSDDSITASPGMEPALRQAPRHDVMFLTGGAIGDALPMATGAALACPDRKVIAVSGDGSALYTLQALWTMAREKLDVTTIICANRSYAVLKFELARVGALNVGPKALSLLDLHDPIIDWVKLANGMGVEASRAETCEDFADQFAAAMRQRGPRLIEAVM